MNKPKSLVLGGGGFIGGHLIDSLKSQGHWVRSVDLVPNLYGAIPDDFVLGDLRNMDLMKRVISIDTNGSITAFDYVYQLAADMGGAGFIFSGDNDAEIMHNSATINLNLLNAQLVQSKTFGTKPPQFFYSSSACVYPESLQTETVNPGLKESDAYPAGPDSEYGWEKLFGERLFMAYSRNHEFPVRIARFHNIFGPKGTWKGGREKSPAAISRKVAQAQNGGSIEVWGDGNQTRSYLFIDECIEGINRLMQSDFVYPLNLGSDYSISINQLVELVSEVAEKQIKIKHIDGPLGVRGRRSDNTLIQEVLGWKPTLPLIVGIRKTYNWINEQLKNEVSDA